MQYTYMYVYKLGKKLNIFGRVLLLLVTYELFHMTKLTIMNQENAYNPYHEPWLASFVGKC